MSDPIWFQPPPRAGHLAAAPEPAPAPLLAISIDGRAVEVRAGVTILDALREHGIDTPTLCFGEGLTPANACRVCVVELEGARVLAPACARKVEAGMKIQTDSERVRTARRLVLELLGSSVDLSTAPAAQQQISRYGAHPERFGTPAPAAGPGQRDARAPGHHHASPDPAAAETVRQPVKVDNELYVRDYGKCVLCYKCVEACGADAQNSFAIAVAGRGFDARISTEHAVPLTASACVYCGNCIAVCPTGALMPRSEHTLRAAGQWDPARQTVTDTICSYCGVGCTLSLVVQDGRIVKVASPAANQVTHGNLCIKGRFGYQYVQGQDPKP